MSSSALAKLRRHTPEKELQDAVLSDARLLGWLAYHPYSSKRSVPGFPDLVLVRERVVWCELKSARGVVTEEQKRWHQALRAAGQEVYILTPREREWFTEEVLK